MLKNQKPLKATVDAVGTLKNLDTIFTSSSTCITELMQNSRRAGATSLSVTLVPGSPKVETIGHRSTAEKTYTNITPITNSIIIQDNGTGIDDFSKLFCFSNSGWDAELQDAERSYGVGFFSVLFYAESISVESNGIKYTFTKDDILNGNGSVASETDFIHGTKIHLNKVKQNCTDILIESMRSYCRAYPLEVTLNAEVYNNDFNKQNDGLESRKIPLNEVIESDLMQSKLDQNEDYIKVPFEYGVTYVPKGRVITSCTFCDVEDLAYLQSLPIIVSEGYISEGYRYNRQKFNLGESVVTFLNDNVPATHPDRNSVHGDMKEIVSKSLREAVIEVSCNRFEKLICDALSAKPKEKFEFFKSHYNLLSQIEFKAYFWKFDALLATDFADLVDRISINSDNFESEFIGLNYIDTVHDVITESWVNTHNPIFVNFESELSKLANAAYILANELAKQGRKVLLVSSNILTKSNKPKWLTQNTLDLELCDIEIIPTGNSHEQSFDCNDIWIPTIFSDAIQIRISVNDEHSDDFALANPGFSFTYEGADYYATSGEDEYDVSLFVPYTNDENILLDEVISRKDESGSCLEFLDEHTAFDQFLSVNRKSDCKDALKEALEQFLSSLSHTRLGDTLKAVKIDITNGQTVIA
ncbi:ATP-binding protein [Vibrio sp. 10N.239.312.D08]|uniref:ATP-binding protein n=1 Tax=Vibrio sp. 10N.239.312.D08 TaxID=3229978 RepID=UPI00354DA0ED